MTLTVGSRLVACTEKGTFIFEQNREDASSVFYETSNAKGDIYKCINRNCGAVLNFGDIFLCPGELITQEQMGDSLHKIAQFARVQLDELQENSAFYFKKAAKLSQKIAKVNNTALLVNIKKQCSCNLKKAQKVDPPAYISLIPLPLRPIQPPPSPPPSLATRVLSLPLSPVSPLQVSSTSPSPLPPPPPPFPPPPPSFPFFPMSALPLPLPFPPPPPSFPFLPISASVTPIAPTPPPDPEVPVHDYPLWPVSSPASSLKPPHRPRRPPPPPSFSPWPIPASATPMAPTPPPLPITPSPSIPPPPLPVSVHRDEVPVLVSPTNVATLPTAVMAPSPLLIPSSFPKSAEPITVSEQMEPSASAAAAATAAVIAALSSHALPHSPSPSVVSVAAAARTGKRKSTASASAGEEAISATVDLAQGPYALERESSKGLRTVLASHGNPVVIACLKQAYAHLPRAPKAYLKWKTEYAATMASGLPSCVAIAHISDKIGKGVFAARDIKKGELIGIFSGKFVLQGAEEPAINLNYCFSMNQILLLSEGEAIGAGKTDAVEKVKQNHKKPPEEYKFNVHIDGKEEGSFTKLINHSDSSNVEHSVFRLSDGIPQIIFSAKKLIKEGRQLVYNYRTDFWRGHSRPEKITEKTYMLVDGKVIKQQTKTTKASTRKKQRAENA